MIMNKIMAIPDATATPATKSYAYEAINTLEKESVGFCTVS